MQEKQNPSRGTTGNTINSHSNFTASGQNRQGLDTIRIRNLARGQWRKIYSVLGLASEFMTNKHGPCPFCGGTDRFRYDDKNGDGTYFCSQCGPGNGFSLAAKLLRFDQKKDFPKVLKAVAEILGIDAEPGVTMNRRNNPQIPSDSEPPAWMNDVPPPEYSDYYGPLNDADFEPPEDNPHLGGQEPSPDFSGFLAKCSPAEPSHAYLVKKDILPNGALQHGGNLVIPVQTEFGNVAGVQFIPSVGSKRFAKGTQKNGNFFLIGTTLAELENKKLLICEGFATGATLYQATGYPVAVAFDAGNLSPVAKMFRRLFPEVEIIVCGDFDANGVGQEAARKAATKTRLKMALPVFTDDELAIQSGEKPPSDFNDLGKLQGSDSVKQSVEDAHSVTAETISAVQLKNNEEPVALSQIYPYSDLGNAKLFVEQNGQRVRYCMPWKRWLIWDGAKWNLDETGEIYRMMKATVTTRFDEAKFATDLSVSRDAANFALKSQSYQGIENGIRLAQTELGIPVQPKDLDSNPWLLQCGNGTLNLKTGQLQESDRNDLITKNTDVPFIPDAGCLIWLQFLAKITNNDKELIRFLQRAIGYSLTGLTVEHALFYLYGLGRNGKSTFLEVLNEILGQFSKRIPSESLMVRHNTGIPNDIAGLHGARVAITSEIRESAKLNEELVKVLTGGDTITARHLYQEYFQFKPTFKIWIAGNHKPIIHGTDLGIWRRILLIPFTALIPEHEVDKGLPEKLRSELPGILAWCVFGCLDWQHQGLNPPQVVRAATEEYKNDSDIMGNFLDDSCLVSPNAFAGATPIYKAYHHWAVENGLHPMSQNGFSRKLTERGFEKIRIGTTRQWKGVCLRDSMTRPG